MPWVDARYRTIADRESRAISGKSSGGFGAMITPMLRPDLFGALATPRRRHPLRALLPAGASPRRCGTCAPTTATSGAWWDDFQLARRPSPSGGRVLLIALGCSAGFSPGDDGRPVLPFDPRTGRAARRTVWAALAGLGPGADGRRYADALRGLRAVWIDAGTRDEYYLDLGAQAFRDGLWPIGVPDDRVYFELFDGGHGGIDYRYPLALAWLAHRLAR